MAGKQARPGIMCPECKFRIHELDIKPAFDICCEQCQRVYPAGTISYKCTFRKGHRCLKASVGLCKIGDIWVSRCRRHLEGDIQIMHKSPMKAKKTRFNPAAVVYGLKKRVIRSGEFPGQHV